MWATNTLWFDTAVVMGIFAIGNITLGHFEEHRPKWRRLLKVAVVLGVFLTVSAAAGRIWAFSLLALPLTGAAIVHLWWLPKHGVHGWTGEPKERYYELIGHKRNG